jgi:hypothetical protein
MESSFFSVKAFLLTSCDPLLACVTYYETPPC